MRWWVGPAVCEEVLGEFEDGGKGVAGGEGGLDVGGAHRGRDSRTGEEDPEEDEVEPDERDEYDNTEWVEAWHCSGGVQKVDIAL